MTRPVMEGHTGKPLDASDPDVGLCDDLVCPLCVKLVGMKSDDDVVVNRVQLVVLHPDNTFHYHPVPEGESWRIDGASRCLVIGKFPRTYIPLDSIRYFRVELVSRKASRRLQPDNDRVPLSIVHTPERGKR